MKKAEIIIIDSVINNIKANYKPEDYKAFSYVFLRNQLKFKSIIEERDVIQKELASDFTEGNLEKHLNSKKEWIDFLDEEVEINLYTMKLDALEKEEFDLKIAEYLTTVNILVE